MSKDNLIFAQIRTVILSLVVFLFPLFFLPFTQDFFAFNKLYLLAGAALSLVLVTSIEYFVTKTIVWQTNNVDKVISLLVLATGLSVLISSPNKVQAVFNTNFGLLMILSLGIISMYIVRVNTIVLNALVRFFLISSSIVAVMSVILFLQPLKSVNLPEAISFLKIPYFNTIGNILDLSLLMGFALVLAFSTLLAQNRATSQGHEQESQALLYGTLGVVTLGLILSLYVIVKPLVNNEGVLPYPPYRLSWAAAVDTLKSPVNALFGVGVDNFGAIFTREKDLQYNQSNQWQISSFNVSRSTLLHVLTEGGLLVAAALVLMVLVAFQQVYARHNKDYRNGAVLPIAFAGLLALLFPPSIVLFFILFLAVALSAHHQHHLNKGQATVIDTSAIFPIYATLSFLGVAFVLVSLFFLGRVYLAETHFRKAVVADAKGDLQKVYDEHVQAILLNPYVEGYRISFSRVNMFIANNIASQAQKQAQEDAKKAEPTKDGKAPEAKLSDQDKQSITERIQVAIAESKAAATLNPQKAINWENLAVLYRNILTVAEGADAWTLSAYQRAISIDPNNPIYRLNLGGVYYSAGAYADAQNLFAQAVSLKPDWPNAYYNLAWAAYQKQDFQTAVAAMQGALTYLNPKTDKEDYTRAQKELAEFKKKIPAQQTEESTGSAKQVEQSKLALPTAPVASVEPKIQLPADAAPNASPEAQTTTTPPGGP